MIELGVSATRVVRILWLCAAAVVALSIAIECLDAWFPDAYGMHTAGRVLRLRGERNVGALFSGLLLASAAGLLAVVGAVERASGGRDARYWQWLSVGFLYLCADEVLSLHERLHAPMREVLGEGRPGGLYFAWVLPAMFIVLVIGVGFFRFWSRLERPVRTWTAVAAAIYLGGAIGMEMVDGAYAKVHGFDSAYVALVTAEETMEMCGVIVFIGTLLRLLGSRGPIVFRPRGQSRVA